MAIVPSEMWRDVVGFEGKYQVSNHGRVLSLCYGRKRILKQGKHPHGYRTVTPGGRVGQLVHRLVAAAWIGPCLDGFEVNHKDGDKTNNCVDNLEYVTRNGNVRHAVERGLMLRKGEDNPSTTITNGQIKKAYHLCRAGVPRHIVSERTGVPEHTISAVVTGKRWKCLKLEPISSVQLSRVPDEKKIDAVRLSRQGLSQSEICNRLQMSKGAVYRALKNARPA